MNKYSIRLKATINFIKDIEVEANDKEKAYRIAQNQASKFIDDCIEQVECSDNGIKHNMSYYDTTQPRKIEEMK